jgi:hypothetical protein
MPHRKRVGGYLEPKVWAAHSVGSARLAHVAGKLMGAFNDGVLTVQRRRSGGKQVVQVIHQQVAVGAGGNAIVAGLSRVGARSGPNFAGRDEIRPAGL